jgi:hypothetical protein
MKNIALALTPLMPLLLLVACGKHGDNPGKVTPKPPPDLNKPYALPVASQANPIYDGSNYGIYKGVAIAATETSKTFGFNIGNNSKAVYCLEYEKSLLRDSLIRYESDTIDRQPVYPLTPDSSLVDPNKGFFALLESYIPDSADVLVNFNVNGDGSSPNLYVHTQNAYLSASLKERSGNQVFCYVGTWQGSYVLPGGATDSGKIAFVINADSALALQIDIPYYQYFEPGNGAPIVNHQFVIESFDGPPPGGYNFILTGTISGNTVSGTWTRTSSNATGTFTAQRTL